MQKLLLGAIRFYQKSISRILSPTCRYYPSCSQYAIDAIKKHGPGRGTILAARRVFRCHPFARGGYDPVE